MHINTPSYKDPGMPASYNRVRGKLDVTSATANIGKNEKKNGRKREINPSSEANRLPR